MKKAGRLTTSSAWRWWSPSVPSKSKNFSITCETYRRLNLGRWDYMAGLIHFNLENQSGCSGPNTIPHDVRFFRIARADSIGVPSRRSAGHRWHDCTLSSREVRNSNSRALGCARKRKKNEATGHGRPWTGHPDQNEIASRNFYAQPVG